MSLTSILKYGDKNFKDFRSLLSNSFPLPKIEGTAIKAVPKTKNYSIVGTAFDYLLRFTLEKNFKSKVHGSTWVSESALIHFKSRGIFISEDWKLSPDEGSMRAWFESRQGRNKKILKHFDQCKEVYLSFVEGTLRPSLKIFKACLFLAKLDIIYRAGPYYMEQIDFLSHSKSDIDDLKRLISICDFMLFKPKKKLILNPTFGKGSQLVGGADADIIIDDCLIEVKVKKELKLKRTEYNQLIGYYLLYLIGGVTGHKNVIIKSLGVYFARHNILWTIPIKEIDPDDKALRRAMLFLRRKMNKKKYREEYSL